MSVAGEVPEVLAAMAARMRAPEGSGCCQWVTQRWTGRSGSITACRRNATKLVTQKNGKKHRFCTKHAKDSVAGFGGKVEDLPKPQKAPAEKKPAKRSDPTGRHGVRKGTVVHPGSECGMCGGDRATCGHFVGHNL